MEVAIHVHGHVLFTPLALLCIVQPLLWNASFSRFCLHQTMARGAGRRGLINSPCGSQVGAHSRCTAVPMCRLVYTLSAVTQVESLGLNDASSPIGFRQL